MASEASWYVRSRGRTQGPFPLSKLAEMRDRGVLARFHQLSKDQAGWIQAGSLPELFPVAPAVVEPKMEPGLPLAPAPGSSNGPPWFYSEAGAPVGPVPFADLLARARSGKLTADTLVWNEDLPDWVEAGTVAALRGSTAPAPAPGPGGSGPQPIALDPRPAGTGSISGLAIAGFLAGLGSVLAPVGYFGSTLILVAARTDTPAAGFIVLAILAFGGLAGILGVVLSATANSRIHWSGGTLGGRGLAVSGLVLAILGLVAFAFIVFLALLLGVALLSRK